MRGLRLNVRILPEPRGFSKSGPDPALRSELSGRGGHAPVPEKRGRETIGKRWAIRGACQVIDQKKDFSET